MLLFVSCKMYTYKKYQIGKQFDFKNKSSYLQNIERKNIFPADHILYIDSASYLRFVSEKIQQDSSVIYLGCFLNDSIIIKRSEFLNDNTSCAARMLNEIRSHAAMKDFPDSMLSAVEKLSSYKLIRLGNGSLFTLNNETKKMNVFLNYTYQVGTYYDEFYKSIMEIQKEHSPTMDVYVVCIDYLSNLK